MSGDTINDGGPMFSRPNPNYDGNWDKRVTLEGASLRDWFAGQALVGLLANPKANEEWITNHAAKSAYNLADAMLEISRPKKGAP